MVVAQLGQALLLCGKYVFFWGGGGIFQDAVMGCRVLFIILVANVI